MLPTRNAARPANRINQTRRQLINGNVVARNQNASRQMAENVDVHSAAVLAESRKNSMVGKWRPVLNKCREIPQRKFAMLAALMENQMKHFDPANRSMLFEDQTTTANIADFTRFALPLIRKSYAKLIADQLVGVQPMNQPASLIFYIRYRYAMTKGQTVAGTQIMRQNTAQGFARNNGWAIDPYYTSQTVRNESATITGSTLVTATLSHRPVLAGTVVVEVFPSEEDASPNCDDAEPCLRVSFDSSGNAETVVIGDCTEFTDTIEVDTNVSATAFTHATGAVKVTLSAGSFPTGAVARISYEYDLESNPFQPEVTLSIDSDSVGAVTRKLKTSWSLEAAQDLKAVHNINAETTLTDLMADEMVAEIDREIINDLIVSASIRATHNFATAAGASVNFTDRNIALMYKTLEVANIIHRTTLRGPANWAVMSADICSKFEQLNDFRASDAFVTDGVDVGIMNAGTIQNKLKIMKDPLFPNCKILMGFKGNSVLDSGYFYAPYIPLLSTPTIMDPNSYSPSKGIMCRYGKKLIEDGGFYYATISVSNL
jgi:hypothetical protein